MVTGITTSTVRNGIHGIANMVRGDIKPHNVLIFQDPVGIFRAKMADFDFSTWNAAEAKTIPLLSSWPWTAPDYECPRGNERSYEFFHDECLRMDVHSYGLLCFWLAFEEMLSVISMLWQSPSSDKLENSLQPDMDILDAMKESGHLV